MLAAVLVSSVIDQLVPRSPRLIQIPLGPASRFAPRKSRSNSMTSCSCCSSPLLYDEQEHRQGIAVAQPQAVLSLAIGLVLPRRSSWGSPSTGRAVHQLAASRWARRSPDRCRGGSVAFQGTSPPHVPRAFLKASRSSTTLGSWRSTAIAAAVTGTFSSSTPQPTSCSASAVSSWHRPGLPGHFLVRGSWAWRTRPSTLFEVFTLFISTLRPTRCHSGILAVVAGLGMLSRRASSGRPSRA
ncbi:MAG: hypothetical protein ACLSVD_15270 [Eggerthellaceae bacterium]